MFSHYCQWDDVVLSKDIFYQCKRAFSVKKHQLLLSLIILSGTDFMARLQEQLEYFVHNKLSTDKLWQNVRVYLSGHEVCYPLLTPMSVDLFLSSQLKGCLYFMCVSLPNRLQERESIRSWSLFALRTGSPVMTPIPDTACTAWMLTW